jgi:hypothetical protein
MLTYAERMTERMLAFDGGSQPPPEASPRGPKRRRGAAEADGAVARAILQPAPRSGERT